MLFKLAFIAVILVGLLIRLYPARNNNFYFTMDQGNDAVHVREIISRGQILLKGPETGIKGFHHGPLWYYFIAPGYLIFSGHPFGAVFMLILLNLVTTALLMYKIKKYVGPWPAILVGTSLQFFWGFFDASRYGFNPFPLVTLSILLILLLTDLAVKKSPKSYLFAAVPVGLAYHCETAAAIPFTIFYALVGIIAVLKNRFPRSKDRGSLILAHPANAGFAQNRLKVNTILVSLLLFSLFFMPFFISEIQSNFNQIKVLKRQLQEPKGVFAQTQYQLISQKITPQNVILVTVILTTAMGLFLKSKPKNKFTGYFSVLSLALIAVSLIWFGASRGWQVWHTVYIGPLLFITILLVLANIIKTGPLIIKQFALLLLIAILVSQFLVFKDRYLKFAKPFDDPSLLKNELAAVDWVYEKSQNQGFSAYSYLPSVEDYPYQYLIYWRGTKKYGYVPCEYSTFPKTPSLFVPGLKYYQGPQKPCNNLRFLIIEPGENQGRLDSWIKQTTKNTILLEEVNFGAIRVQMRQQ